MLPPAQHWNSMPGVCVHAPGTYYAQGMAAPHPPLRPYLHAQAMRRDSAACGQRACEQRLPHLTGVVIAVKEGRKPPGSGTGGMPSTLRAEARAALMDRVLRSWTSSVPPVCNTWPCRGPAVGLEASLAHSTLSCHVVFMPRHAISHITPTAQASSSTQHARHSSLNPLQLQAIALTKEQRLLQEQPIPIARRG